MQLTNELLAPYVGGQAEIQNSATGLLIRGEMESIRLEDGNLVITWAWMAKGDNFPAIRRTIRQKTAEPHSFNVYTLNPMRLGPDEEGRNRLALISSQNGDMLILCPPHCNTLDCPMVEDPESAAP